MIAKVGGIRPLLALVESRHTSSQRSAVHALAMLALNNKANQDAIVDFGGLPPLLKITDITSGYAQSVQEQAVLALAEIARGNRKNQTTIGATGVNSLVSLLRYSKSHAIEAECAGAIWARGRSGCGVCWAQTP